MDGRKVLELYDKMRVDRGNMENLWQDAIRYCLPYERRSWDEFGGNDTTPGKRRASPVCSLPVLYASRLAAALHNSAFPSNSYWFDFGFAGDDGKGDSELRRWCREARDKVHFRIRSGTNFYQESHTMVLGLVVLGTAGFYTYYKNGSLRFRYIPIHKNFYIARNSDGDIDMAAILHEYTAKEAVEEYGGAVSERVKSAMMRSYDGVEKFRYVQLIYPKTPFGEKWDAAKGGKPYGDVTVEQDTGRVVRRGGHRRFPFAVSRFMMASDDLYGRSPAMNAMSDIKSINVLRKNLLEASLRAIKPAVFINSLIGQPVSLASGALNRVPNFDPNSIWTFPQPTNFPVGNDLMVELRESLIQAFYIDVFQAVEQQDRMTATEVTERVRQKVEAIASVVSRLQREFSRSVVLRCLDLLIENGEIEPPPLSADMKNFDISFMSSLDAMIQQGVASQTMTFIMQATSVAQAVAANPDFDNVVDTDAVLRRLADCNMLPESFFRPRAETERRRAEAAEAAANATSAQSEALSAKAMLDYAKADQIAGGGSYNGI